MSSSRKDIWLTVSKIRSSKLNSVWLTKLNRRSFRKKQPTRIIKANWTSTRVTVAITTQTWEQAPYWCKNKLIKLPPGTKMKDREKTQMMRSKERIQICNWSLTAPRYCPEPSTNANMALNQRCTSVNSRQRRMTPTPISLTQDYTV